MGCSIELALGLPCSHQHLTAGVTRNVGIDLEVGSIAVRSCNNADVEIGADLTAKIVHDFLDFGSEVLLHLLVERALTFTHDVLLPVGVCDRAPGVGTHSERICSIRLFAIYSKI